MNEHKTLSNEQIERLIAAATRKAPRMALINGKFRKDRQVVVKADLVCRIRGGGANGRV